MSAPEEPAMNSWQLLDEEGGSTDDNDSLPGARLRALRESKGLGVEEVAEALHLHKRQIDALEGDDYGHFSAPIFVVGYLRSYARLLGVDPEPLLAGLGHHAPKAPEVRSELKAIPIRRHRLRGEAWGIVALVAAVLILAALWGLSRHPAQQAPAVAETPAAPPAEPPAAPAALPETAPPEPTRPPATGQATFRFSADSWIEVTDAEGRRLAARMGRKGDALELEGVPPFDVLLGNAASVSVEYNGQPYGKVPANRQNVASFKLGQPTE
jgi:cytoskeleton protein RodZ